VNKEGRRVAKLNVLADSNEAGRYLKVPDTPQLSASPGARYVCRCSNNTVYGTQWRRFPDMHGTLLVAEMISDVLARRIDYGRFAIIFAAAQKNLEPPGAVVIRRDWLASACDGRLFRP